MTPPFVKICGLSQPDHARLAADCGADAVGFVNFRRSPRHVSPEQVRDCCRLLPSGVRRVLVCVDAPLDEILPYLDAGCDVVQLHGRESAGFARSLPVEAWLALRLGEESDGLRASGFPCSRIVCDSAPAAAVLPGGTGIAGDWQLAARFVAAQPLPVLLAGGLHAGNLRAALEQVRPAGVDLSSGVESAPGLKDPQRIREVLALLKG